MKTLITLLTITILGGSIVYGQFTPPTPNEVSKDKLVEKYNVATEIKAKYQIDRASLKRSIVKNAELDKYKGEPKDEIEVILGDINSADFTPDIEMKRWNEVSFKLKPRLASVATKDKNLSLVGDKIKFDTPKMSYEMYEDTTSEEGGYKFIWYLNEPPLTNKIEFDIETAGLDFFYQPALNVENTDPNLTCTETQCKDIDGNIVAERPENVVGSYAVYHSTKGKMNDTNGKEYKVGKAFHIYRPHIIDAVGKETWGILHIENGIYSVEIPQDFLDTAQFPLKSNDTFGYTSIGASSQSMVGSDIYGSKFTAPVASTVDSITAYGSMFSLTANVKGIMVLESTLNIISNGVGAAGGPFTTTPSWQTSTFGTPPNITNTDYDISLIISGNTFFFYYDTGSANQGLTDTTNNYTTPTNPTDATRNTRKHSIYATYTPSGGGAVAETASTTIRDGSIQIRDGNLQIRN